MLFRALFVLAPQSNCSCRKLSLDWKRYCCVSGYRNRQKSTAPKPNDSHELSRQPRGLEAVDGLRPRRSRPVARRHRLLTSPITPFPTRVVRGADTELEENWLAVLQTTKACFREKLNLLPGKLHLRLDLAVVRRTSTSRHICPATTSRRVKTRGR